MKLFFRRKFQEYAITMVILAILLNLRTDAGSAPRTSGFCTVNKKIISLAQYIDTYSLLYQSLFYSFGAKWYDLHCSCPVGSKSFTYVLLCSKRYLAVPLQLASVLHGRMLRRERKLPFRHTETSLCSFSRAETM